MESRGASLFDRIVSSSREMADTIAAFDALALEGAEARQARWSTDE